MRLFILYLEKYTDFTVQFELRGGALVNQMIVYHDGNKVISFRVPGLREERHLMLFGQHIWKSKIENILQVSELKQRLESDTGENKENIVSRLLREAYETQARTLMNDTLHTTISGMARKVGIMTKSESKLKMSVKIEELKKQTNHLGELLNLLIEYGGLERSLLKPKAEDLEIDTINASINLEEDVVVRDLTSIIENDSFSEEKRKKARETLKEYNLQKTQEQKAIIDEELDEKADIVIDTIRKNYLKE